MIGVENTRSGTDIFVYLFVFINFYKKKTSKCVKHIELFLKNLNQTRTFRLNETP